METLNLLIEVLDQSTPRPPCSPTSDIYKTSCVICGCAYKNTYEKFRISEDNRANNVLKATIYFRDEVYVRTRDLQYVYSVFGADLYCHKNCIRRYLHKYDRALKKDNDSGTSPTLSEKEGVFNVVLLSIDADLRNGVGYPLSEMKDACTNLIDTTKHKTFTNKELKVLLFSHFQDEISFTVPPNPTKSAMVYVSSIDKNDIAETVRNFNPIKETALKMREILLKENDPLEDKFCDANDLSDAWYNIKIPEVILEFLCVLLNVDHKGFYNIKIPEVILEFLCVLLNVDHKGFYNIKIPEVILEFLCVLLNVDHKGFYNIKIPEVILEFLCVLLNVDHKGFYNIKIPEVILEFLCVLLNVDHKGFYII